jgi:hypothetical protein
MSDERVVPRTLQRRLVRSGVSMALLGVGVHLLLPLLAGLEATSPATRTPPSSVGGSSATG